jgi:ribosomal protein L29
MRLFKIKPLTEEEKAQKLAELRDKMAEKRALKAAEEAKEAKANELIRRKGGKVRTILDFPHPSLL